MTLSPYYDDGQVVIYHGDCMDVLPELAADPSSAVLSDPPYGIGVRYGAGFDDSREDYWQWFRGVVDEMRRVSPVVAFTHRVSALKELGGWDWVAVWHKPMSCGTRLGNSPVLPHWEPILLYGIHSLGTVSEYLADVLTINPERSNTTGVRGRAGWKAMDTPDHPTPKPLTLYRKLIATVGQSAETIIDPFAGSGTTLRAAKDFGRKAIGIEIEERYCEIAAKRLDQGVLDFGAAS